MSLFSVFSLSSAGLSVQRQKLDIVTENLANVNTTRTPEGGPYKPKDVIVGTMPNREAKFDDVIGRKLTQPKVTSVVTLDKPPTRLYDPHHPDADSQGYVATPDISPTEEMMKILLASTAYEANMSSFNSAKSLIMKTLDLGAA